MTLGTMRAQLVFVLLITVFPHETHESKAAKRFYPQISQICTDWEG